jgi:hypothetical protein
MTESFNSIEGLAGELGISARTAYRWLRSGKIKRRREGGRTLFTLNEASSGDKIDSERVTSKMSRADTKAVNLNINDRGTGRSSSVSVESLKAEVEGKKLALELRKLEEIEARADERMEREKADRLEIERNLRLEVEQERIAQERVEKKARERIEKVRRVKMAAIPAPLMATIPPHILSLTLSEIEIGLTKLDIDNLSERELLIHAEAIRSKIWSDSVYNREVRQAGVRAVFEDLDQYLHSQYDSFEERKRALWKALGKRFNGNMPEEIRKEIEPWTFERFIDWSISKLSPEMRVKIVQESETFIRFCEGR